MAKRNIKAEDVMRTVEAPNARALDTMTGHFIAMTKNNKWLIVVYDVHGKNVEIVTVYEVSRKTQIENRLKGGRWVEV
ncbi:DUF4258 domain-containing protein [Thermococcus indicus]|uniref:DUF4258 domain-containing protein n=2 Tax=Thermococcus indicus TaxID=2586643 RepID=A0A4Y5SKQ7_9EURY|nr:DUF4258 domain-containing protein [Thermococcus indicus]